jgi:predicted ester cyclase
VSTSSIAPASGPESGSNELGSTCARAGGAANDGSAYTTRPPPESRARHRQIPRGAADVGRHRDQRVPIVHAHGSRHRHRAHHAGRRAWRTPAPPRRRHRRTRSSAPSSRSRSATSSDTRARSRPRTPAPHPPGHATGATDTGTGRRVEGTDAYIELAKGWKAAFPDATGTIDDAVVSGDMVAQEIRWEATHTGPMQTPDGIIEPTDKRISIAASLGCRFDGDHARELHHYLDVLMLLQQIGAMPAPGQ